MAVTGLAPQDPLKQNLRARFTRSAWIEGGTLDRPLGTDPLGRDLLSRIIFGARISLVVGTSAVLLSSLVGLLLLGLICGFLGGIADNIIMAIWRSPRSNSPFPTSSWQS